MASDAAKGLARIRQLLSESEQLDLKDSNGWRERARLALTAAYGPQSDSLQQFDEIRWSLSVFMDTTPASAHQQAKVRGLRNSVDLLKAVEEDLAAQVEEPSAPEMDPKGFHPWVADASASLWHDAHHASAVNAAAGAVETRLKLKVDEHSGSTASLVAKAFSTKPPEPDSPRLRFTDVGPAGSDNWNSAHDGAGAFGRGCFMRIRNLYTHGEPDPEHALEALAALSLLARWINDAEVEKDG